MNPDMDNLRNLLARNLERTLPEQVQYAYLTLLGRLEQFTVDLVEEIEDPDNSADSRAKLEWVHQHLTQLLSKNIRLKHKVLHNSTP
jgi:hypothetical protein